MAWLGEELPAKEQDGRTPFAPRCLKDVVEERLFAHRRDLFARLDLVFMDTTSLYFEGAGGQTLGRRGYSKDHRPDLRQMILAVLIDGDGHPVCSEMWPGNTADVTTLIPVIERSRRRFDIVRVCVVADRGMIAAETIAELEARKLLYILGVRERSDKLVRELVLGNPEPFVPQVMTKRGKEVEYEAKTVSVAGRRYIVCRNHAEAAKDAADRTSILTALEWQLVKGDKALVGNTGYRRYLNPRRSLRNRSRQGRGGQEVRRHLRAAHQHRSQSARCHAVLQTIVDGGADISDSEAPALDATYLSQARRDNPLPRVLQFFGSGAEESLGRPRLQSWGVWVRGQRSSPISIP
jgi:hypothetical protein